MLVDTHAHLDFPEFQQDLDAVLERATAAGVRRIVTIGTSLESSASSIALAEQHEQIYAVVGIHPTSRPEQNSDSIGALRKLAAHPKVLAIGETGLDFHRLPGSQAHTRVTAGNPVLSDQDGRGTTSITEDDDYRNAQRTLFNRQLDLAAELNLNVVIHQRDAWEETLEILRGYSGQLRGVFHCFGGTPQQAATVYELGHLISFTGIVTFKNAAIVRETAIAVPENAFMIETDCPYLAPVPHRGKRCEPAFAMNTARRIAELRAVPIECLAEQTTRTAEEFFPFSR